MPDRALALSPNETTEFPKETSIFDLPEWTGAAEATPPPIPRLLGLRFQRAGKVYHYSADGFPKAKVGDWVIVETARGRQMAQVATVNPPKEPMSGYKRIERMATGRDMATRHFYENKELEAMIACRAESAALRLPVKIVRAEYSFDGQTLTFLYSSDEEERVEVGELREAMSRLYRARLEFRQISPREVAKLLGGLGACGIEERCCSRFLTEFSPISIKHAKEQNLSLNPNDITGMCGRLRCCLVYEFEQYVEAKRQLPKVKSMIGTPGGEAKVLDVFPMQDTVMVRIGEGEGSRIETFHREQLVPLEEWKRLQAKAASGTCDKHEGGGCDCGRQRPARVGAAQPDADRRSDEKARGEEYQKRMEQRQKEREQRHQAERDRRMQQRRDQRAAQEPPQGAPPTAAAPPDASASQSSAPQSPPKKPLQKHK